MTYLAGVSGVCPITGYHSSWDVFFSPTRTAVAVVIFSSLAKSWICDVVFIKNSVIQNIYIYILYNIYITYITALQKNWLYNIIKSENSIHQSIAMDFSGSIRFEGFSTDSHGMTITPGLPRIPRIWRIKVQGGFRLSRNHSPDFCRKNMWVSPLKTERMGC